MAINFNDAPEQKDMSELIPGGTIAKVKIEIERPTGPDVGSMPGLTRSSTSTAEMLKCAFTIMSSPLQNRMLWQNIVMLNTSEKAMNINRAMLRAILESARGIKPNDVSALAISARQIDSFLDLDGIQFVAKISIEQPKDGYGAKNKIALVVTPDRPEYQAAMAGQTSVGTETVQAPAGGKSKAAAGAATGATPHQWPSLANGAGGNQQQADPAPGPAQNGRNPLPAWARG